MQVKRHCAVKYRMYPNRAQAALIDRTIGCARFIYNQMLETRIGTFDFLPTAEAGGFLASR